MYPDAPVIRQRNGDGPGQRGVEGDDSAILAVPRRSQRLALREERLDTAPTAESARLSSFAVRVDGSWRSVATARRWTSSRASGSAMASSSQIRSRADRKTHMLNVPSSASRKPGMSQYVFAALPAARRANHRAGEAGPRALRGMIMTSCSSWPPGGGAGVGRAGVCWLGWWVAAAGCQASREEQHVI